MPTVPVTPQNEQRLQGISGARFDAPDIGAGGRAIGAAIQRTGQAVAQAGQVEEDILTIRAEARAKAADNAYQEFERDILFGENGYYNNQNDDAFNAARPTEQAIREKVSSLVAGSQDHRERAMLQDVLMRRAQATFTGISRYAQAETVKFRVSQASAGIENASENYARYYSTDTERATAERATMRSEFERYVDLTGMNDATMIETAWNNHLTEMHSKVVNAEMMRDPVKAATYLDSHRDEIDPDAATILDNRLEPLLVDRDSDLFADDIQADFTTSVVPVDVPASSGQPASEGTPAVAATSARTGTARVVNRAARPVAGDRARVPFPASYRDSRYDALDQTFEAKYGLPEGLLTAIRVHGEKSNANQVSSAGARGVYQFIASTRQGFMARYGIDPWRSPQEQVEAAAIHLRDDILKYGSVEKAVAAYNGGHRGATAPVKETRDYVGRVMGAMGGSVAGYGAPDRGVPGGPSREVVAAQDLERQLEAVEPYVTEKLAGKPPRYIEIRVEATKAELRKRHAEQNQSIRVAEAAAWEAAQETAFALGDGFTSITQIPGYQNLPIQQRVQLDGLARSNVASAASASASAAEIETDWGFYARVQELADTDPAALQAVPLEELRSRLADTEFKEIAKLRTSKPGAKDKPKALTVSAILSASQTSLNAAGLVTGNSKEARGDAEVVNGFSRSMMQWAQGQHAKTGNWPDDEQIRVQADKMLIRMTYEEPGRVFGTNSVEAYAFEVPREQLDRRDGGTARIVVPKAIEQRIRRSLPAGASDADVRRIYVQGKGTQW